MPVELTRAALRRAWVSDPAIRDFIGLAENQWDFTKPDGVPGFGSLELTAELRRMVAELAERDADRTVQPKQAGEFGKTAMPRPRRHLMLDSAATSPVADRLQSRSPAKKCCGAK